MSTIATFIGIDRYAALDVRDLSGARRDALGLWCLFSDSVSDIKPRMVCNEEATTVTVREAIRTTLKEATAEDTVIFSFSGHGTPDHRLVLHDTHREALHETTIPMAEIADAFRTSKAGTIICIIDCCFSGGAPARVLDDAPIPRDLGDPYAEIVGSGRVLIAASAATQVAYEHPTARYGLLTKAIIEVLSDAGEPLGIGEVLDRIMDRVRADAGKIGVTQTPYLVNKVEGGMRLPVFRKGKTYRKAFPETGGIMVGSAIGDLTVFGIPLDVLNRWSARYSSGLNQLQQQAINEGRILDGASLFVVAPTSSGKTFIGELATVRAVAEHRKAVFLVPYKALVNEKFDQFQGLYGDHLDYRVIRCTGDYGDQVAAFMQGKYELAILTYEMFLNIALDKPALLHNLGLVVLDEAHFITDPSRGITVELLLTYLLSVRERGIAPQLITLSAVIGGVNDFDAWLDCKVLMSDQRPVPLVEGVIDRTGAFQYVDAEGQPRMEQFIPKCSIVQRRDKPSSQDVIVPLVNKLVNAGEKVIVFRNQRGKAQGCAAYLANDLDLPPATEILSLLPTRDSTTASAKLRECLNGGTAFHTSNLTREEREIVERAYREPDSLVKVLGATTTVAAGINTPADTVIIAEQEFKGDNGRPFTIAEYKNMAGRAGRLGISERGRSIIYAETPLQRQQLFDRYVQGTLEPLRSSFSVQDIETWIIKLLAQVQSVSAGEVIHLLSKSYGGYLENRKNPKWQHEMTATLEKIQQQMLELGLIEEELGQIRLTLLGRACGTSSLSFASAMRLVKLVKEIGVHTLTPKILIALIQALPEMDQGYTPFFVRSPGKEAAWREKVREMYGIETVQALQRFAPDNAGYVKRCKRVCMLYNWISGVSVEEIERLFTTNPYAAPFYYGDVRNIADSTRFHLRSIRQIVALLLVSTLAFEEEIDNLLLQLEIGIPADTLDLLKLPISLSRGDYLALRKADVMTCNQLWQKTDVELNSLLDSVTVARLRAYRETIL
ncbi:DEAD/DEAH box helicase [Scytonema tolypothrichoides VB-61278]|nr:DEAD/DEAH box helicase [Scytonema tolypothrichoides VB-61278]